jgi:hypothetical protein
MPHLVDIPIALFEITIQYVRPNMKLLLDRAKVVDALFEVFSRWNIGMDNIEVINEGKPSEQGIRFKIPEKRTTFMLGGGSCTLIRDDVDWTAAEEIIDILTSAYDVVQEVGGIQTSAFKTNLAMHLQPKTAKFMDILVPFCPPQLLKLDSSTPKASASVVKWDKRRITLDGSNQLANGVFVRLEREFLATASYEEIAHQLRADELELFDLMDVSEDHS